MEVMKKAGLETQEKYVDSKAPWRVKHNKCQRIFEIVYSNIRGGSTCRYCSGRAVVPKEAINLMKKRGLNPLVPFPGARAAWKCKCNVCKKIIYPQYSTTANRESGCAYCSGHKVDAKDAIQFMKLNNVVPLVPYPGARVAWKSKCKLCKNIISPQYSSIKGGQGACRFCADWGIDYSAEGFIYLMTNHKMGAHKLGIGNTHRVKGNRINQHKKHGWELIKQIDFNVTDDAFQIEQKVLRWLREDKGLAIYLSEFEMPQGGYTETVEASEIDPPTIWAKVEELSRVKR
jgi:hypothetical protein